jgi:hypothetical protein
MDLQPVTIIYDDIPPSFNAIATNAANATGKSWKYLAAKQTWGMIFRVLLGNEPGTVATLLKPRTKATYFDVPVNRDGELPHPMSRVLVEGEVTFPDRIRRDQGNYRTTIEKFLGDALVEGGWLPDDDWGHYEFGNLERRYEKGVRRVALTLFPQVADPGFEEGVQGALVAA